MEKLLSLQDVMKLVNDPLMPTTIISKLSCVTDIENLLSPRGNGLLLYDDSQIGNTISGHWCCLKRLDDHNISFYDSYGEYPDDQIKNIPKSYKNIKRNLTRLLHDSKYEKIHYNPYQHQEKKIGVNTCGRHAAIFMLANVEPEMYNKLINWLSHRFGMSKDEVSVYLTEIQR